MRMLRLQVGMRIGPGTGLLELESHDARASIQEPKTSLKNAGYEAEHTG
jgi:hypothetical protein